MSVPLRLIGQHTGGNDTTTTRSRFAMPLSATTTARSPAHSLAKTRTSAAGVKKKSKRRARLHGDAGSSRAATAAATSHNTSTAVASFQHQHMNYMHSILPTSPSAFVPLATQSLQLGLSPSDTKRQANDDDDHGSDINATAETSSPFLVPPSLTDPYNPRHAQKKSMNIHRPSVNRAHHLGKTSLKKDHQYVDDDVLLLSYSHEVEGEADSMAFSCSSPFRSLSQVCSLQLASESQSPSAARDHHSIQPTRLEDSYSADLSRSSSLSSLSPISDCSSSISKTKIECDMKEDGKDINTEVSYDKCSLTTWRANQGSPKTPTPATTRDSCNTTSSALPASMYTALDPPESDDGSDAIDYDLNEYIYNSNMRNKSGSPSSSHHTRAAATVSDPSLHIHCSDDMAVTSNLRALDQDLFVPKSQPSLIKESLLSYQRRAFDDEYDHTVFEKNETGKAVKSGEGECVGGGGVGVGGVGVGGYDSVWDGGAVNMDEYDEYDDEDKTNLMVLKDRAHDIGGSYYWLLGNEKQQEQSEIQQLTQLEVHDRKEWQEQAAGLNESAIIRSDDIQFSTRSLEAEEYDIVENEETTLVKEEREGDSEEEDGAPETIPSIIKKGRAAGQRNYKSCNNAGKPRRTRASSKGINKNKAAKTTVAATILKDMAKRCTAVLDKKGRETKPKMSAQISNAAQNESEDSKLTKQERNRLAAQRSRDRRAQWMADLIQENERLKKEVLDLKRRLKLEGCD